MDLLGMLESLGGRLGIIEKPSDRRTSKTPAKIRTRVVTLAELKTEIRADEVRTLAEAPAELTVPFEKIFETAGIESPKSGWNIERLSRLLHTDPFRHQPRESVQRMLLEVLSKDKVDPEALVKDAVARDQALDAFERFAERKMSDRIARQEQRLNEVKSRIDELRREGEQLEALMSADRERWRDWQHRKRVNEQELAWAVGHLVDRPVITTAEDTP